MFIKEGRYLGRGTCEDQDTKKRSPIKCDVSIDRIDSCFRITGHWRPDDDKPKIPLEITLTPNPACLLSDLHVRYEGLDLRGKAVILGLSYSLSFDRSLSIPRIATLHSPAHGVFLGVSTSEGNNNGLSIEAIMHGKATLYWTVSVYPFDPTRVGENVVSIDQGA